MRRVLDLPNPPARWVIAATARDGQMWGKFVDDFRRAPIPHEWIDDAEIRGVYYDVLDSASEPFKEKRAKPAMVHYVDVSLSINTRMTIHVRVSSGFRSTTELNFARSTSFTPRRR